MGGKAMEKLKLRNRMLNYYLMPVGSFRNAAAPSGALPGFRKPLALENTWQLESVTILLAVARAHRLRPLEEEQ
jgi:hypothetical protein